jgi:hypothetical protein
MMADEVLENLKMWPSDPVCVAAARRVEKDGDEIERQGSHISHLEADNARLKEQVASLQASSGYEASIAQVENERLEALLRRWIIWNGEDRHHDLLDESRRALEAK